jgi:Flp pilus assembly protein TadG
LSNGWQDFCCPCELSLRLGVQVSNQTGSAAFNQRGVALLELALILPLLLLIIAGVADFGLALRNTLVVSDATRFGARQAVLSIYQDRSGVLKRSRTDYCRQLKDTAVRATTQKLGDDVSYAAEVSLEPELTDLANLQDAYLRNVSRRAPRQTQLIRVRVRDNATCFFCFGEVVTRTMVGNETTFALDEPCLKSEFEAR